MSNPLSHRRISVHNQTTGEIEFRFPATWEERHALIPGEAKYTSMAHYASNPDDWNAVRSEYRAMHGRDMPRFLAVS